MSAPPEASARAPFPDLAELDEIERWLKTITHFERQLRATNEELERKNRELERMNEELRVRAITDALTGLANRAHGFARLEEELSRRRRTGAPLAVVLLDLDHFKRINDTRGHLTGDTVLVGFAGVLKAGLREHDLAARFGGEEFLLVLPETDGAGARAVAEKIRAAVAAHRFPGLEDQPVTLSAGYAIQTGDDSLTLKDLLRLADEALYRAKAGGRNRVEPGEAGWPAT